ncbi:MAG: alpha/beta fold hydrolase [Rhizomicrobium sp.]
MKKVILVGHSQAGTVMPRMAELRPDLFKRLVYVSCPSPLAGGTISEMIGNCLHGQSDTEVGWPTDPATSSPEERYRIMFCNDMAPEQANLFIQSLGCDAWPASSYCERNWRYDHLATVPTSYVIFLKDMSLPAVWQERFAGRFHADRVIRIDAGHQGMITRPHALAEVLLAESLVR